MKNMNEALNTLVEMMKADYIDWSTRCSAARGETELSEISQRMIADMNFFIEEGRSYYKIIKQDRSQQMVAGFVVKKTNDKKGFQVGDLLKAASYNAPATNFIRGSIFDLEAAKNQNTIRWTGIQ